MQCPICEATVGNNANICPKCGHVLDDESKDIEHLIQDILDEDEGETDERAAQRAASAQIPEKKAGRKSPRKKRQTEKNRKELAIMASRYAIGLFILLSLAGMLMPWAVLQGRGASAGFIVDSSTEKYIEGSGSISLSGFNLLRLALDKGGEYSRSLPVDGEAKRLPAATIHVYYMYALGLYVLLAIVALAIVLMPLRLKGQSVVRNLAAINLAIAALNMLALKFIYFSAFAIRARQAIALDEGGIGRVKYTLEGLAAGNDFHPYEAVIAKGFYFTLIMLAAWFLLAAGLNELRNKEELDRIDREG